jgi:hypothetical protein
MLSAGIPEGLGFACFVKESGYIRNRNANYSKLHPFFGLPKRFAAFKRGG